MRATPGSILAAAAWLLTPAAFAQLPDFPDAKALESLAKIRAAMPAWSSVNINVYANGGRYTISDTFQRIDLSGDRLASGEFRFTGWVGSEFISIETRKSDPAGYELRGAGISTSLRPAGGGWSVWGHVDFHSLNGMISRFGRGYTVRGQSGLTLDAEKFGGNLSIQGNADLQQVTPKALATLATALTIIDSR